MVVGCPQGRRRATTLVGSRRLAFRSFLPASWSAPGLAAAGSFSIWASGGFGAASALVDPGAGLASGSAAAMMARPLFAGLAPDLSPGSPRRPAAPAGFGLLASADALLSRPSAVIRRKVECWFPGAAPFASAAKSGLAADLPTGATLLGTVMRLA